MFKKIITDSPLYLFWAFIFTVPFQKRHIFNLATARINEVFTEWQVISIYVSDILLILCLILWAINLIFYKKEATQKIYRIYLILPIAVFIISLISILANYSTYLDQSVAIYKIIKLAELILLFIFIIKNINTKKTILISLSALVASGVVSSIIAILQYLKQQTLGLTILGEPLVLPILQNVAKIVLDNGNVVMRAYGTFPHPNVLAGFLLANLIFALALVIYISVNYGLNKPKYRLLTILISFGLILEIFAFIFTFSRTAWIALVIALILFFILIRKQLVLAFKNIKESGFYYVIALVVLAIIFAIASQRPQITSRAAISDQHGDQAVTNRAFYNKITFEIIKKHPIIGIGYGNFVSKMQDFTNQKIAWWQYQPAHNIYLLIWAETGIFTLLSLLAIIIIISYQLLVNKSFFNLASFCVLVAFLIIALFDHYIWTIQQGQLLFWIILGFTATKIDKQKTGN
ncbi:MAG: O-antigen ligase family protein [Patescibacteria group bacterium]|nr:O-antigen ligase family protein [Patescibacteria group bacterium]